MVHVYVFLHKNVIDYNKYITLAIWYIYAVQNIFVVHCNSVIQMRMHVVFQQNIPYSIHVFYISSIEYIFILYLSYINIHVFKFLLTSVMNRPVNKIDLLNILVIIQSNTSDTWLAKMYMGVCFSNTILKAYVFH